MGVDLTPTQEEQMRRFVEALVKNGQAVVAEDVYETLMGHARRLNVGLGDVAIYRSSLLQPGTMLTFPRDTWLCYKEVTVEPQPEMGYETDRATGSDAGDGVGGDRRGT